MNQQRLISQYFLEVLFALAALLMCVQVIGPWKVRDHPVINEPMQKAKDGDASLSLRNRNYPKTYISEIHVDLESPNHWVQLAWSGPLAASQNQGPFGSSPGMGDGCDCNDWAESNREGSYCTPKGEFMVEGFNDFLPSAPSCMFATWFHIPREIAFHSHRKVPSYPASHGCIRLKAKDAQLIHNNSVAGRTKILIDGNWTRRPQPLNSTSEGHHKHSK